MSQQRSAASAWLGVGAGRRVLGWAAARRVVGAATSAHPTHTHTHTHVHARALTHLLPAEGKLMNDFTGRTRMDERQPPSGSVRTYTVALDTAQYQVGGRVGGW